MDDKIHRLIATVSPETYCQKFKEENDGKIVDLVKKVRETIKEKDYIKASEQVKTLKAGDLPAFSYDVAKADAMNLWGLKSPLEEHKITYDSPAEGLEPIYFWLLDFLSGGIYDKNVEKITDNFVSSPGSGHFSEMQGKATQMQQEASRTLGNVNTVLKSVLNLVYDLKEFKIRLSPYKTYLDKNSGQDEKNRKLLSLKQVWLDNVDIRKGRGSINALSSGELDFVTLRDAFMTIVNKELKDAKGNKIDLNDRVTRILQQRAEEFFLWITESYNSLSQRYEIERNYLKSQVNMLKLYARWVRPYLNAAQKLEQSVSKNAALVTAFNTMTLELQLLATKKYEIKDDAEAGLVPDFFKKIKTREYYKVLVLELDFRSIPQRVSQRGDWSFGGRAEIKFTSYALNEQELEVLKKELSKNDLNSVLSLVDGATKESLDNIEKDITAIIEGKEESEIEERDKTKKEEEEKKKKKSSDDFGVGALFSIFRSKKKEKKDVDLTKGIEPDTEYEKVIRSQAILSSNQACFTVFDTYKKAHGMPSHADPYDQI
ncbi:MAG: hypothetical protein AABW89_06110 [Nanoarchaeota archaeon]